MATALTVKPDRSNRNRKDTPSIAIAMGGVLHPIGNGFLNAVFAAVRVCMAAGLLCFLLKPDADRTKGLWLWTLASMAVCMLTLYKWMLQPEVHAANIRLYLVCLAADLGMPVALWHLFRGENPDRSRPRRKGPKHEDSDDPSPEDGN